MSDPLGIAVIWAFGATVLLAWIAVCAITEELTDTDEDVTPWGDVPSVPHDLRGELKHDRTANPR